MSETSLHIDDVDMRNDLRWTHGLLVLSLVLTSIAAFELVTALARQVRIEGWFAADEVLFLATCAILLFGNFVHQLVRFGLARRMAQAQLQADPAVHGGPSDPAPLVTILVPAYKEEPEIVLRTLLASVCQTHINLRVVLLLDDPPHGLGAGDADRLGAMRGMPARIASMLQPMRHWAEEARAEFRAQARRSNFDREAARLRSLADGLAFWFDSLSVNWARGDHTEQFFAEAVVRRAGRLHRERIFAAIAHASAERGSWRTILASAHDRLCAWSAFEVSVFERKRYANLPHDANKAMNLNSYIACIGRHLVEKEIAGELQLVEVDPALARLAPPASPFLLTLDADSILLPEYAERLVAIMEQPGNERLAVLQTPYATFPGAAAPVERIAGATTDIQLLLHQGYSHFGATFWVGANALLRRAALDEIAETTIVDGHPVTRYVQDRTVIEDTESTLDLIGRGWKLHNHPKRLAFSATPPDFGTLIIQRRRWACGGLLILPKLLRLSRDLLKPGSLAEFTIRFHYLASLAYGPVAVLLMLFYPFEDTMDGIWLPLTALPYFIAYGRDLAKLGYRRRDLLGVYALNLLLVPIHLAGAVASIRQWLTGRKIPFRRTPKVAGRVGAPRPFVLVAWGLPAWCAAGGALDLWMGHVTQAAFAGVNAALFVYGAVSFVGLRASFEDLFARAGRAR
ncbi:MAG: glycosyltransferase family 2 protein [Geminicoccaceae bacterium]